MIKINENLLEDSHFLKRDRLDRFRALYAARSISDSMYIHRVIALKTANRLERDLTDIPIGDFTYTLFLRVTGAEPITALWEQHVGITAGRKRVTVRPGEWIKTSISFTNEDSTGEKLIRLYFPNAPVDTLIEVDWEKLEEDSEATLWVPADADLTEEQRSTLPAWGGGIGRSCKPSKCRKAQVAA